MARKENKKKKKGFMYSLYRDRHFYIMSLPAIVWFIIFAYIPMAGIYIAFTRFLPGMTIFGAPWTGLDNFRFLLNDPFFWRAFRNTAIISTLRIVIGILLSVGLAILFNELRSKKFRFMSQTFSYLPFFLSWVIVSIFFTMMLRQGNIADELARTFDFLPAITMTNPDQFRAILIVSVMWREVGYSSIIFTAALMNVSPVLVESLEMDGGNRWHKIWYISLPTIRFSIVIILILWIGAFVTMGFEQVINMYNPAVFSTGDIVDTYVFRIAFSAVANYGAGTAAGLMRGILAAAMMFTANYVSKRLTDSSILF